mgnify:CR=1 FL=1
MFSQGSSNHERRTKKTRRVAKPKRTTNSVYKKKYNQFLVSLCQDETGTLVDHYVDGELRKQMDTIRSQSCYNSLPFVEHYDRIASHERICLHMIVYETRQCMLQWTKRKRVNKSSNLFHIITKALQTYNTIPSTQRYHACFDALHGDPCRCFCGKTMYSSGSSDRSNGGNNTSRIHPGFLQQSRHNNVPKHKRNRSNGIMDNLEPNASSSARMMMPTPPSKKRKTLLLGEPTTTTTTTTTTTNTIMRSRSESMEVELSDQDEKDEWDGDQHELHQLHAAITDQEIQEVKDRELAADAAVREGVRLRQGDWGDRAENVEDDDGFIQVVPDSDDDMGEDEELEDYDDIGDDSDHDAGFN